MFVLQLRVDAVGGGDTAAVFRVSGLANTAALYSLAKGRCVTGVLAHKTQPPP